MPSLSVSRAWQRVAQIGRDLWARAKEEPSRPRDIGYSVALGGFMACTPFVGFHLWLALGLASLLRLNRVWAMVASRLSSTPIFLATTFSEIELAHRLRTGAWVTMNWRDAFTQARELILDWGLGTLLVGLPVAAAAGLLAYTLAVRWQRLTPRRLAAPRLPSSEFPQ